MSQSRVFTLLGDSAIQRHVNKNSCRANPSLKTAQMLSCGGFAIFEATLAKVRSESTACIVSCVTNFLADSESDGTSTLSLRVDPVFQALRSILVESCSANPSRSYLISPPLYRTRPTWYREGLPEIMTLFSQAFSQERPPNLFLLPSFATPEFEADGINLNAYSGLEYILHLFDSASECLDRVDLPLPERAVIGNESTRVLEDRMMAIEQDHRRLSRAVESKNAIDAEMADFHLNERNEDFFVIEGLERIPDEFVGKEWQKRAVADVKAALKALMGREISVVFVKNSTGRHKDAIVSYNVQMATVQESRVIRRKYGSFFFNLTDERPDEIKHFAIKNLLTPETKIRISILKLLAKRYRDSNPGAKVKVIGHQPRPLIKITPPPSADDRRVKTFNYIEAVTNLKCSFSEADVEPIVRRINPKLHGQIRSLFIVLSDDSFKRRPGPSRGASSTASKATNPEDGAHPEAGANRESTSSTSSSATSRGSKRGAEGSPDNSIPAKK